MRKQHTCDCLTPLTATHCLVSIALWILLSGIALATVLIANNPSVHGFQTTWLRKLWIICTSGLLMSRVIPLRLLIMFFFPRRRLWFRDLLLILLVILPPVLELAYLIKAKGVAQEVLVYCTEFQEELSAVKLADAIKKGDYFAQADDENDPSVNIVTPLGIVSVLIRTMHPSLYLYIHLEDNEIQPSAIQIPANSLWRIETAADGSAHAAVCELYYCPETVTEEALADRINAVLDALLSYYKEV